MTNRERVNVMPNEELAQLLVATTEVEEIDYDWDENPYGRLESRYGNEMIGWYDYHDDAIKEMIKWLETNVEC